jgi:hypothetical protein
VSCKDYDDDIKNLQTQIDKAALKSELTALQTQLTNASTNAETAMKNLEEKLAKQAAEQNASNADLQNQINAVKAAADEAAKDLAAKIEAAAKAAADAQQAAGDAAEAAKAAKEAAEQAVKEAVAKLNEQNALLSKQLEQLGNQMKEYVTATELSKQIEELKNSLAHNDNAGAETDAYKAAIAELYKALTSIELIDSYTGIYYPGGMWLYWAQGNKISQTWYYENDYIYYFSDLDYNYWMSDTDEHRYENIEIDLTHGIIPWDSQFGDNELGYKDIEGKPENVEPFVKYTKGADIKAPVYGLIVRANPVNADLTTSDLRLINSLGEDLSDFVKIGTPERFHALYATTRSKMVNNGLWIVPLEIQSGKNMNEEKFKQMTTFYGYLTGDATLGTNKVLYALAANNTQTSDEERYVVSSYDIAFDYTEYVPANHFTFNVYNELNPNVGTSVNDIHNRYAGPGYGHPIFGEDGYSYHSGDNWELEWLPTNQFYPAPTPEPVKDNNGQNYQNDNDIWNGVGCAMNDMRWWKPMLAVGLNETFTIADFEAYSEWGDFVACDSLYVVLDKKNAVESEPSEINAWESYKIEGLNKHVTAAKGISLKVTDPRANGDVIGFRVFAVNRDGSLVDPDGRAFYVLVTDKATNNSLSATVTATVEGNTDTSTEMNTDKKWNNLYKYVLTIDPANNPKVVVGGVAQDADLSFFQFNWNGGVSGIYGGISADLGTGYLKNNFKKLTITPQNIENLLDGATYTFKLTGYEVVSGTYPAVEIPRTVTLITLTKLMPNKAKDLTFRPKQETTDGSGDVIAYMIPNKQGTVANAYAPFADFNFAPHFAVADMEACYDARDAKASNGFKNLTNIFYNLSKNGQNGFDADPLVYDENEWDKTFEFVFATSDKDGKKDLVDGSGKGVAYEHPQGNETWQKYMLEVPTKLIDGTTKHDVKTSTVYKGISTKLKADGSVDCYNKDYPVANGQNFTFTYACWHHANTFAWKAASAMPKLKWTHEGVTKTSPFTDIVSANTYDPAFFGDGKTTATSKTLNDLAIKNFLIGTDNVQLNTQADGKGQKNPYYVPSIAGTTITYKQASTQTDAAPVADHTEYLIITMKDAFNHDVKIVLEVLIQRP